MVTIRLVPQEELRSNGAYKEHKKVIRFEDSSCGLKGFVAIYDDTLGVAVGGTRMYPYASEQEALSDVLNLSYAMTYKCAIAGIEHGGGKAVIIGDPLTAKNKELLKSYAEVIGSLAGEFYTGEDVGLTEADVIYMLQFAPYYIGKPGQAGDPSNYAALSVFVTMQEAAKKILQKDSLDGLTVSVKGLGKVGHELVRLLDTAGARVIGADISQDAIGSVKEEFSNVHIVEPEEILSQEVDIYAPCALGNEFSNENVGQLHAKVICGSANNQLANPTVADLLEAQGIVYVPDYLANAGGLIDVADELELGGYNKERVAQRIGHLRTVFKDVFEYAQEHQLTMSAAADRIAERKFITKPT